MKKNVLPMVVIVGGGFLLWNLAFMMLAGIATLERLILRTGEMGASYGLARSIYLVLILLITYLIFRTKFPDFIKATVLTVPMISILVMIGMKCYIYPIFPVAIPHIKHANSRAIAVVALFLLTPLFKVIL